MPFASWNKTDGDWLAPEGVTASIGMPTDLEP